MTPEELQRFGERVQAAPRQKALQGLEGDSDTAAQAVELEKSTGTPSQTIYGYNEQFVKDYKGFLTQRMLDRNPGLAGYIEAHPMAAIVSKDDWNRMADFYDHLDYWMGAKSFNPWKGVIGGIYGFQEKFRESLFAPLSEPSPEDAAKVGPLVTEAWKGFKAPFETVLHGLAGVTHGLAGFGEGAARALGRSEGEAREWGRAAGAAAEYFMTDLAAGGGHMATPTGQLVQKMMTDRALKLGEPWLKADELPPPGVHPVWDAVNRAEVERKMSVYDALVDMADKADTKAKSPDLMEIAAAVKLKNEQIFLHWDAVKQLYGDKIPEPGDGILGDVPGFIDQYRNAVDTATDIQVPLATWLSKIDPEVVKALHDDIRFRPGEPTLREVEAFPKLEQAVDDLAKPPEAAQEVGKAPLEELVTTPPGATEAPIDRLLRLRVEHADRLATHGALEHAPTKEGNLLQSLAAVTGRKYTPDGVSQAMRWAFINGRKDIVDRALELAEHSDDPQLSARLNQELENLNKYADAQNAVKREMAQKAPLGWEVADTLKFPTWSELLRDPNWKKIGEITAARVHGDLTAEEAMIKQAIGVLFERLGGPQAGVRLMAAREIRMGLETPYPATASYVMAAKYGADVPTITFLLGALDPVNSLGHEFMHHLKRYGFLTEKEWAVLAKHSEAYWIEHHRIRYKYDERNTELLIEEGVTHEFGKWYSERFHDSPEVQTIFQKIGDFIDQLRVALKELFGRELTPEEIFEKIYRGDVARREEIAGADPRLRAEPLVREAAQRPEIEVPKIEEEGLLGILPKGREQRYLNLINKQNAKDVQKLFDQAYKDELKRQKPEWQKNYADQYAQSMAQLKDRPDFRAAAFFRSGIIMGQKLDGLPKIDPTYLTKEQKAALPEKWFRQRDGLAPDDIAGYLGYRTGTDMINDLIRFEEAKGRMKPETFLDLQAATEAERRMEAQYGNLDENVLREAREHAVGLERFDLMHEETLALAAKLGQEFTLTKQDIRDQAAYKFNESINSQISLIKYTREIGKSNRAAENAWLKGDALGAYVERQRTLQLQALAEHAREFERDKAVYVRNRNRFRKREVDGMPPEYTNWVHHLFNRVGEEIRDPTDLKTEMDAYPHGEDLGAFLKDKSGEGWLPEGYEEMQMEFLPSIPVWEKFVEEPSFTKHIDAMTVGEFRAVNESVKALIKAGRDELRGVLEGKAFNRQEVLDKMTVAFQATMIDKLPPVGDPTTWQKIKASGERMLVSLIQMEYIWGRLDQTPYGGLFYKHFTKPFAESGNEFRLLIAEYGRKLNQIKKEFKNDNLKEKIPNDVLREPLDGKPPEIIGPFQGRFLGDGYLTRADLRGVMLNLNGDPLNPRSNISKLARGYHADAGEIMEWVNRHATPQDWAYVQKIWKLFDEIQGKDDIIAREMSGVAPKRLPLTKIKTAFGDIQGGYFPMIYDQSRGGGGKGGKVDPDLPSGIKVLSDRGWEIQRTGYAGPVSLSLGQIETQLTRRLRSIGFREVIEENQRFFRHAQFQRDMTKHLGPQYTEMLLPYLRDMAGIRGPIPKMQQAMESFFNYIQQNTIMAFVGLNPGTLMKHNFTAFAQSFKEAKISYLARAAFDLSPMNPKFRENHKFMMQGGMMGKNDFKGSAELQGRRPNWDQALGGETDVVTGEQTIRSRVAHFMSGPIAITDQMISKWLWLAKYREVMDDNLVKMTIEDAHNEAVAIADQAVRRTHGSTAITSRPAMMRWGGAYKPLTALYGFFNHIFNRMYEISWEARKHRDLQTGEAKRADVQHLASQIFFAVVPAAIIEELVTPLFDKDDRSWTSRFLFSLGFPVASSFPIVREIAHGMFTGHDPSFGILQGSMKAVTDLGRQIKNIGDADKYGDSLQALNTLLGVAFGVSGQQPGRWSKFAYNYMTGRDQPQSKEEWWRAFRYGTSKERRH